MHRWKQVVKDELLGEVSSDKEMNDFKCGFDKLCGSKDGCVQLEKAGVTKLRYYLEVFKDPSKLKERLR